MSQKELLCASLDNSSVNETQQNLSTSNPNKQLPLDKKEKQADGLSENVSSTFSVQVERSEKATTSPDGGTSLGIEQKDPEKVSNSDDSTSSDKPKPKNSDSSNEHLNSLATKEKLNVDNHENSEQDYEEDLMTTSYGEISLDQELLNCDGNSDSDEGCSFDEKGDISIDKPSDKKRPDSLILNAQSKPDKVTPHQVHQCQQTSGRVTSTEPSSLSSEEFAEQKFARVRTSSETSGLSDLQGTLTVDGDVVTFVAEDLAEKIKMSSPVTRWPDSSSFAGSHSSTPSLYKQALQPSHHIIDPTIITDLEAHAKKVATCVYTMLENLSGTLQSISSLTVDCMETYENSVCKTCDSVDLNIKAVYQLMAKCEELNNSMGPLYCLSTDMKYIKMMLEQLEHIVEHKS